MRYRKIQPQKDRKRLHLAIPTEIYKLLYDDAYKREVKVTHIIQDLIVKKYERISKKDALPKM